MTIEEYIEEQGYTNIAEDTFECPGGHVWHIDEIRDLSNSIYPTSLADELPLFNEAMNKGN